MTDQEAQMEENPYRSPSAPIHKSASSPPSRHNAVRLPFAYRVFAVLLAVLMASAEIEMILSGDRGFAILQLLGSVSALACAALLISSGIRGTLPKFLQR